MVLALAATALVALALLSDLIVPRIDDLWTRYKARRHRSATWSYDPGRERRAEARARALLRSCVNEEEWAMYHDLGFLRVWGTLADGPDDAGGTGGAPYAYLIYPHRPILAYLAQTHRLLNEYCVDVPGRDPPVRQCAPARLRRRAREVDGADRRRAQADRDRQHAPPGPPARSVAGAARPVAAVAVGARADARRGGSGRYAFARSDRPPEHGVGRRGTPARAGAPQGAPQTRAPAKSSAPYGPQAQEPRADRRARARRRPRSVEGHRLRRRSAGKAARSASRTPGSRRCRATSTCARWRPKSRRGSGKPAGRRWSSTRSRSRTGSRWAPRE